MPEVPVCCCPYMSGLEIWILSLLYADAAEIVSVAENEACVR